jgi:cell volume regulation protein A
MEEFADFFPKLFLAAALLLASLVAAPLAKRLGLPGPAAFLAVGIVAGLLGVAPTEGLSTVTLEQIGSVALYAILFQGGLSTGFRAWRRSARPILLLGLPGTAATAGALALLAHALLGLDWSLALLVGIALAPTDPAAVYAVLRGQGAQTRARTVLEGESGFNDPVGISLMVVAVSSLASGGASFPEATGRLSQELGIGLVGGLVGGFLLIGALRATPRLEQGFQAVAIVVGALLVGAGTATVHGSGFLAVYLSGLLVADRWAEQDGAHHAVPEAVAAVAEPVLFGLLGAAFAPLVGAADVGRGLALALASALVVRPAVAAVGLLGSGLQRVERVLVAWGGLKGAVPLLLAAYPALERLEGAERAQAIVLVATAVSILVQGATLSLVATRVPEDRRADEGEPDLDLAGATRAISQ